MVRVMALGGHRVDQARGFAKCIRAAAKDIHVLQL